MKVCCVSELCMFLLCCRALFKCRYELALLHGKESRSVRTLFAIALTLMQPLVAYVVSTSCRMRISVELELLQQFTYFGLTRLYSVVSSGIRHFVLFVGYCSGGLVKRHEFHYEDTDVVDANFDMESARSCIAAWTTTFTGVLKHFQTRAEEILLKVDAEVGVVFQSYHQHVNHRTELEALQTAIQLDKQELDTFQIDKNNADIELTFGLREFKAFLHFCEHSSITVISIIFSKPGDPFLLTSDSGHAQRRDPNSKGNRTFYAELILATYQADEEDDATVSQSAKSTTMATQNSSAAAASSNGSQNSRHAQNKSKTSGKSSQAGKSSMSQSTDGSGNGSASQRSYYPPQPKRSRRS